MKAGLRRTGSTGCLLLALGATGCAQFNAGMNDMFARLVLGFACVWGTLGLVGLVSCARGAKPSIAAWAGSWILSIPALMLVVRLTDWFRPWPGSMGGFAVWSSWALTPAVCWSLLSTARLLAPAPASVTAPRAQLDLGRAAGAAASFAYVGILIFGTRSLSLPPLGAAIEQVAFDGEDSYGLLTDGRVITLFAGRECPGRFARIAGDPSSDLLCGVTLDKRLSCTNFLQETKLSAPEPISQVALDEKLLCVVTSAGKVQCAAHTPGARPVLDGWAEVPGLADVAAISLAESVGLALRASGEAIAFSPTETLDTGLRDQRAVATGKTLSCFLGKNGQIRCVNRRNPILWFTPERPNATEELAASFELVDLPGPAPAEELVVGTWHACARRTDGAVWCWGANGWGQRGNGRAEIAEATPTEVPLPGRAVALVGGLRHTCARLADQRLFCWGALAELQGNVKGRSCSALFEKSRLCVDSPSEMKLPTHTIPYRHK